MTEELKNLHENQESPPTVVQAKMPKGLIATGIVAIVGSWFGMAVYMNHRISDLESGLLDNTTKMVTNVDGKFNDLTGKINGLETSIKSSVNETSSVLAKGLLDLTENEDSRHKQLQNAIQTGQKQLEEVFSQSQKHQLETVSSIVNALDEKQNSTSKQVIDAIQDTKQSLQSLVESGLQDHTDQLSSLAASIEEIPATEKEKSKIINAQLTALSNRMQEFQNELSDSQNSITQLNEILPQWQTATQEDYAQLKQHLTDYETKSVNQLASIKDKIAVLQQNTEQSTENLLKTLYLTTEGLEGTKYELKSEVETMKQSSKQDFDRLNKSIHSISNSLSEIQKDLSNNSIDTTSLQQGQIHNVIDSVQSFTERSLTLHSKVQSHIDEINAWLKKDDSGIPLDRSFFKTLVEDYQGYLESNNKQIAILVNSIQGFQNDISDKEAETVVDEKSETEPEPVDEEQQTAMHPEERSESEVGVSLY